MIFSVREEGFYESISLKAFPRISFLLTIKGDVVLDYRMEGIGVKITNMYCEHLPALRLIGKRYTHANLDADMKFGSKWNEWFQNGWFDLLGSIGCLTGYERTTIFGIHSANEMAYWIGMFFPEGTPVPEGFEYVDIPSGDVGMCWVHGYKENGELYTQNTHDLCLTKIQDAGYVVKMDFNDVPCKWSFERYNNERFFTPDYDGKVIMDYGIYIVEPEIKEQLSLNTNSAEELSQDFQHEHISGESISDHDDKPVKEHKAEILINGVEPYPIDAESNLLICALTSLFLKLDNYDSATPFFCDMKGRDCNNCGECGETNKKSNLAKHHLRMYHYLITVTGVGLMWGDACEAGDYNLKYIKGLVPPLLEDRLDFAMKAAGYEYIRMDKVSGEREMFRQIKESIRRDMPVLMKLSDGPEWCLVTGFDEKSGAILGLDARNHYSCNSATVKRCYTEDGHFIMVNWFREVHKAVIVTGKSTDITNFNGLIERMTGRLLSPDLSVLEAIIPQMIDSITVDNARGIADYLNNIAGYVIEARWHGAECFGSFLMHKTNDETVRTLLLECMEVYFNTHDTCWLIWGQLGVGPHTDYKLPNLISQMMLEREKQEKLKDLFTQIFNNDRAVLEKLLKIKE